jgi:uncharacterized repeat protein (TIGR01451 family)
MLSTRVPHWIAWRLPRARRLASLALFALGAIGTAVPASAQTISSAANQTFVVNDPSTTASAITVTDAAGGKIKPGSDIYLVIPAALSTIWDNTVGTVTLTGSAAGKVSPTPTYVSTTCVKLTVLSGFNNGEQVTIAGLNLTSFSAAGGPASLQLHVKDCTSLKATDDKTKTILVAPTLAGGANQVFTVGDPSTAMTTATVTDVAGAITPARGIRLRLPASLNMTWNTSLTTATLSGSAAAKVSTTVSYEDAGKTLVLSVTSAFAAGDVLAVSALQFTSFTAVSAAAGIQLVVSGAGGTTASTSSTTKQIVQPTISSAANQTFFVGQAATGISTITITASNPSTITSANDIRVRIPSGFNMTWNTALTTATLGGGAASKVSTTVGYESGGQVLVLNVTSNFAASDQVTVSGLQFANFTAVSTSDNLQLVVSGAGGSPAASDDKTITILTTGPSVSPHNTSASRLPSNGSNYTVTFTTQNAGAVTDSYDLLTSKRPGTALATISITGSGVTQGTNPDSARLTNLAAGGSVVVTVTYSVGNVAAGVVDSLVFKQRSVASPTQADTGKLAVTVIRPSTTLSKGVSPSGTQLPGTDLTYTVTLTNVGSASAATVVVVDTIPTTVDLKLGSVVTNLPAGISVAVEYSNDGGSTWTYTPASGACSAPAGYDRCVNRIRWRLLDPLLSVPPDNTGSVQFISRIR